MRIIVLDDGASIGRAAFYAPTTLGPKQSMTPEGYLLCEEVPIARVGEQLYAEGETPIPVGPNGYAIIERKREEVFRPEFIRSFEGKPFLLRHPPGGLVFPDNWKKLARGHIINPRPGEGEFADYLVADILVTDPETIQLIVSKTMREVSAGYVAEYDEIEPKGSGRGRQRDMLGNHVALVDSARCGPSCAILDHLQGETMKHPTGDNATVTVDQLRANLVTRIMTALKAFFTPKGVTIDEAAVQAEVKKQVDEMPLVMKAGGGTDGETGGAMHIHMPNGATRDEEAHRLIGELKTRADAHDEMFEKLKSHTGYQEENDAAAAAAGGEEAATKERLKEEAPEGTGDQAAIAKDSSFLSQAHQEAASGAEILVPGITIPAFDKNAKPKSTLDSICGLRRRALELSYSTNDGKTVIDRLTGGKKPNFATMDCREERVLFRAAVAQKKVAKDAADQATARASAEAARQRSTEKAPIRSAADLNKANRAFWDRTNGSRKSAD